MLRFRTTASAFDASCLQRSRLALLEFCRDRCSQAASFSTEASGSSTGAVIEQETLSRELPDIAGPVAEGQAGGPHNISQKELEQRKGGAVTAWLEQRIGREKVAVARILQRNGVIVKGGQEQGFKLMDELVAWKAEGSEP